MGHRSVPERDAGTTPPDGSRWTPFIRVRGPSMRPALRDGQVTLVRPRGRRIRVGDIVVFVTPEGTRYVKRVAAVSGDVVEMEAGQLSVDGRPRDGLPRSVGAVVATWCVPEGHVFVVGDDLAQSDDSRVWPDPYVPIDRILGVVLGGRRRAARWALQDSNLRHLPCKGSALAN
jgi:signal peptidase I